MTYLDRDIFALFLVKIPIELSFELKKMSDRRRRFDGPRKDFNRGPRREFDNGPREMFPAKCSDCGKDTEVPFKPTEGKPVYCKDCYQSHKKPRY